jgi:hypothetical protein
MIICTAAILLGTTTIADALFGFFAFSIMYITGTVFAYYELKQNVKKYLAKKGDI